MHEFDDKKLDRLSKEAAEQPGAHGLAPDWEAMHSLLDQHMPVEKKRRRRVIGWWWWTGAVLLLLGGGAMVWNLGADVKGTKPAGTVTVRNPENVENKTEAGLKTSMVSGSKTSTRTSEAEVTQMVANNPITKNNPVNPKEPKTRIGRNRFSSPVAGIGQAKPAKQNTRTIPSQISQQAEKEKLSESLSTTTKPETEKEPALTATDNRVQKVETTMVAGKPASDSGLAMTSPKDSASDTPLADSPEAGNPEKIRLPDINNQKGFYIGVAGGPDWSTVSNEGSARSGYSVGVLAGYQFHKRWSVHTGFLVERKQYESDGSSYKFPPGFWANYVDMKTIEGVCNMWEIPLLVRYHFGKGTRGHFFISTGLSSYHMSRENYDYYFEDGGQMHHRQGEYRTRENYWMGVGNLSVGYQRSLGDRLQMTAEPYWKVALSEMGYGKIRINSLGLMLGLQFRAKPVR